MQRVEHFGELMFSIFDRFLVIDYVEYAEVCKLKTFLLNLVVRYHLHLVELGKNFLLLTNTQILRIPILGGRGGGNDWNDALIVRDVS